ncbi:hypothetical protein H0H92_006084 [Tricholoma furcatifolium]|nr:hypothetical protein H0H92_006084 [Tricholoma furcatifolium]
MASPRSTRSSSRASPKFKLPSVDNSKTQDVFQSIVKGRKSWKTLRGGEVVWPPELEAALLEGNHLLFISYLNSDDRHAFPTGLAAYVPDDSRETRLLGRFPMRNRFISDFIFNKTGTKRTAKQVGSRLQQLRDTCGGKKLMKLLSPYHPVRSHYNNNCKVLDDSDSASESSVPSTPTDTEFRIPGSPRPPPSRKIIHIDLLPPSASSSPPLNPNTDWSCSNDVIRIAPCARHFHAIDPTVAFVAPAAVTAQSSFVVYYHGSTVFSETTELTAAGPAPDRTDGAVLYSTSLVPGFWSKLSRSSDPTQYTIVQDVMTIEDDSTSIIFSAMYKFTYPSQPEIFASPSITEYDDDKLLRDIQASLPMDGLYAMDTTFPDLMDTDPYYDFTLTKAAWGSRSPSEWSSELSGYHNSDDELDALVLSPPSSSLAADLSHYVS